MLPAAPRLLLFAFLLNAPPAGWSADPGPRAAPSRPGGTPPAAAAAPSLAPAPPPVAAPFATLPGRKIGGLEYVRLDQAATLLGLKLSGTDRGRKATITGTGTRADLERDTRDIQVNGLRLFLGDPILENGGMLHVSRTDFERCLAPLLRPGFGVPAPRPPQTIVLDPGHGGKDNGTSANEKTYALDVARRARVLLTAAGFSVVLTRDSDTYVELAQRAALANASRADLFVSLHFNALPNDRKTSGVEVFTFAPRNQHAAEWWSLLRRDDPHLEKTEMPVNRFDAWSVLLAQSIQRRFVVDLKAFDRGRKLAHWGVLRPLTCPGVLVECGFLTSEAESRKIASAEYRQKIAGAVAAGIRDFAAILAPLGTKTAGRAATAAPAAASLSE